MQPLPVRHSAPGSPQPPPAIRVRRAAPQAKNTLAKPQGRKSVAAPFPRGSAAAPKPPKVVQFADPGPEPQVTAQRALIARLPQCQVTVVLQFAFACTICRKRLHTRIWDPWCQKCSEELMD